MTILPDRVLARSFNYLEVPELGTCRAACKKWAAILDPKDTYAVWRACCQNRYPDGLAEKSEETSCAALARQQWYEERPVVKQLYVLQNPSPGETLDILATDTNILITNGQLTNRSVKSAQTVAPGTGTIRCFAPADRQTVFIGMERGLLGAIFCTSCVDPQLVDTTLFGMVNFPVVKLAVSSNRLFLAGRNQGEFHAAPLDMMPRFQAYKVSAMNSVLGKEYVNEAETIQALESLRAEERAVKQREVIPKLIAFFNQQLTSIRTEDPISALHTDQESLFVGGTGKVRVFSLIDLASSWILECGTADRVSCLQSVRGSLFASAGTNIHMFSCETGVPQHLFEMEHPVHAFVIHNHLLWANMGDAFSRLFRLDLKNLEKPAELFDNTQIPNSCLKYHNGKLYCGNATSTMLCDLRKIPSRVDTIYIDTLRAAIYELLFLDDETPWFNYKRAPDAVVYAMPEAERNKLYERVWVLKGKPQGLPEPFGELSFHRRAPLPAAYFCSQKARNRLCGRQAVKKMRSRILDMKQSWHALPASLQRRIYEMAWELKGRPNRLRFGELSFHGAQNLPIDQQCTPAERQHLLKRALDECIQELDAISKSLGFAD